MEILEHIRKICQSSSSPLVFEFGHSDCFDTLKILELLLSLDRPFNYHAFEPKYPSYLGDNLDRCRALVNQRTDSTITFTPKAVGQINGTVPFWQADPCFSQSSSIRKPKRVFEQFPAMQFVEETAETIRFDDYVEQAGLTGRIIDFIWADIQGAEVDLILSGVKTFANVRYLYTEYVNVEHYEGEIGLPEILNLLPDFSAVEIYRDDVLLVNRKLAATE